LTGVSDAMRCSAPKRFFGASAAYRAGRLAHHHLDRVDRYRQPYDEVIFEEFKGTGNSEIILDRKSRISACSRR